MCFTGKSERFSLQMVSLCMVYTFPVSWDVEMWLLELECASSLNVIDLASQFMMLLVRCLVICFCANPSIFSCNGIWWAFMLLHKVLWWECFLFQYSMSSSFILNSLPDPDFEQYAVLCISSFCWPIWDCSSESGTNIFCSVVFEE